jgi:HSP20 family protein
MSNSSSFFSRLSGSFKSSEPAAFEYEEQNYGPDTNYISSDPVEGQLSIDMFDNGDEIVIQTNVAGVKLEDIDITLSRNHIVLHGFRENPFDNGSDRVSYVHQELFWGPFSRDISLPEEVDIDHAQATEDHGMLTIKLPKTDKERVSRIKVKDR